MNRFLITMPFFLGFLIISSCNQTKDKIKEDINNPSTENLNKTTTSDYIFGKWKAVKDTVEIWINEKYIFLGIPARTLSLPGHNVELSSLGIISEYIIDGKSLVGKVNGVAKHSSSDIPLPIKYNEDTIGITLNGKHSKFYRIEKGIPVIEDSQDWQNKALSEVSKRFSKN